MPVISITLLPGYSAATEQRLVQRVSLAARSVIAAPAAGTTVYVKHASTYQRGERAVGTGGPAVPDGSELVRTFLGLMQDRDLTGAASHLAPDFVMHFPGSAPMRQIGQLLDWAALRYRSIAKTYERFDECWGENDTVVYCFGSLHGVWLDGSPFQGIRFVDRFQITNGLICRQDVWNDLAEARPALS
jgi:phenylpyruvate tautomerase PptA (4-oxalocrotonate tautomerase family)